MDEIQDTAETSIPTEDEFDELVAKQEVAEPETENLELDAKEKEVVEPLSEVKQELTPAVKAANAYNASVRKSGEELEFLKAQAQEKIKAEAVLEAFRGIINPFTGDEIKDSLDVTEYKTMLAIQKRGGDPLADYAKTLKQQKREVIEKQGEDEKFQEFMAKDSAEFMTANPEIDIQKLFTDKKFMLFAGSRFGKDSMTSIYKDWEFIAGEFSKSAEKTAKTKAESMVAKAAASPGRLGGGTDVSFSYESMPDADFEKKLAAVLSGKETI